MEYHNRTEKVVMILNTASEGATKTKIMYNAFLGYNQLKEYLSALIDNDLIEYLEGTKKYKTTEKGFNLIRIYNDIAELYYKTKENEDKELI